LISSPASPVLRLLSIVVNAIYHLLFIYSGWIPETFLFPWAKVVSVFLAL
jgi:hypothetical protein